MYKEDFNLPRAEYKHTADIAGFISFLETKAPSDAYCWKDFNTCLYAQFGEVLGLGHGETAYVAFTDTPLGVRLMVERVAAQTPHTYGAALSRARVLQAERK